MASSSVEAVSKQYRTSIEAELQQFFWFVPSATPEMGDAFEKNKERLDKHE